MDEPMSRFRAERMGSEEWIGYDRRVQSLDDLFNLTGIHAQISGGKSRPTKDHFKQPPKTEQKPASNVASFNIAALAARVG